MAEVTRTEETAAHWALGELDGVAVSGDGLALWNYVQLLNWLSSGVGTTSDITESGRLWTVRSGASNSWHKAKGDQARGEGKWYFEIEVVVGTGGSMAIGVALAGTSTTSGAGGAANAGVGGRYQYFGSGQKRADASYADYGDAYTTGDIVGISVERVGTAVTIIGYKNGVSQGTMYSLTSSSNWEPHVCNYGPNGALRFKETLSHNQSGFDSWK